DGLHWSRPRSMRLKGLVDSELVVRVESDEAIPPPPAQRTGPRQADRRKYQWLVAVVVLLVALGGGLVWSQIEGGHGGVARSVRVYPNSVAVVDPVTGRVLRDIRVGIGTFPVAE